MSLDPKTIALISVGASVSANCMPCLQFCVTKTRELGVSEQEIREAIDAGRTVRGGAATKMDKYVLELCVKNNGEHESQAENCGCGCR